VAHGLGRRTRRTTRTGSTSETVQVWVVGSAVVGVLLWLRFSLPDAVPTLGDSLAPWALRLLGWASVGGFCLVAGSLALAHDRLGHRAPRWLLPTTLCVTLPWGLWAFLMLGYRGRYSVGDADDVRDDVALGGADLLHGFDAGSLCLWLVTGAGALWALGRLLPRKPGWPLSRTLAAVLLPAGAVTLLLALTDLG
jgi:hypothetical protein